MDLIWPLDAVTLTPKAIVSANPRRATESRLMRTTQPRRTFLKHSVTAGFAFPFLASLEEHALVAQEHQGQSTVRPGTASSMMESGRIGTVTISRLICGGNLISGYAHSRDLIYVSNLLKAYFTEEKIMDTWALCESHGMNTLIFGPSDQRALQIYSKYRQQGGRMQSIGQLTPDRSDIAGAIDVAAEAGMVGAVLVGNYGDLWTREGDVDRVGQFVEMVKARGMIAGVAGHELRTIVTVEEAGIEPDFYMKTLHSENYWSKRQPDQTAEIIDNYTVDNYWCLDPVATIRYMQELERPWLAYKVLAAGAIPPQAGFQYAFGNGADFCVVGMFDFQIAEDVTIANSVIKATRNRTRAWMA
jgi:hypothetical protein